MFIYRSGHNLHKWVQQLMLYNACSWFIFLNELPTLLRQHHRWEWNNIMSQVSGQNEPSKNINVHKKGHKPSHTFPFHRWNLIFCVDNLCFISLFPFKVKFHVSWNYFKWMKQTKETIIWSQRLEWFCHLALEQEHHGIAYTFQDGSPRNASDLILEAEREGLRVINLL